MRRFFLSCFLTLTLLTTVQPAWAGNPLTKLGRGLNNIVFSPFEYFTNIQKAGDRRGLASGVFEGFFAGTYYMVGRILAGAYEGVTFPIPVPEGYRPVMKPDSVFDAAAEA